MPRGEVEFAPRKSTVVNEKVRSSERTVPTGAAVADSGVAVLAGSGVGVLVCIGVTDVAAAGVEAAGGVLAGAAGALG